MILCLEPRMLFAMYLFRPRSRAASRRANIMFKDMAASTRKRKGKWSEKMREGMMMWWLFISTSKLIGWYDTRIWHFWVVIALQITQWSIGQYNSPWSIWLWEAAGGERSHGPHWILTVSTHNKSGSVYKFYYCKPRIIYLFLLSVLSIVVQPVQLGL